MNHTMAAVFGLLLVSLLMPVEVKAGDEYFRTYLVQRLYVEGSEAVRETLRNAHREHTLQNGRDVSTFRILDEDANVVGVGAWMAFESRESLQAFLDGDPYQKAGVFGDVSIGEAHLYILDEWFSIAPAWRDETVLRGAHGHYDEQVRRFVRE
ncbi:MAG: hypothetical protein JJU27_03490 [Gammaproteobacteria bacterium]|nr:hypothetical protein [Gammaproteobacteria bacterium]